MRKAQSLALLLGMLLVWQALPLLASTVSVGTCQPGLPHFTTIQAAINASAQGGTVVVCPGT